MAPSPVLHFLGNPLWQGFTQAAKIRLESTLPPQSHEKYRGPKRIAGALLHPVVGTLEQADSFG